MENIIGTIIDIDREASCKLEKAEEEKLRIISAAKSREEKLVQEAVESSRRELERLEEEENRKAQDKIDGLEAEKNRKISAMKKSFKVNSDKWCEEIFKAVIS